MKKRIASILACGVIAAGAVAGFAGCDKDSGLKLTVWGPEAQQETLKQMVAAFEEANPDTKYNIKVAVCGEGDAYMNVSKDPSAAADVYGYSNDQLMPLLRCGGLAEVGGIFLDNVKTENSAASVESCSVGEKVYGYPYASDNGYFMYYDKSVITEEQVTSLETIISVCKNKNKKIGWAIDDAWYTAGWFFAFGCSYEVTYGSDFIETGVEIDFNSDKGIKASKAIASLTTSGTFAGKNTNNDTIISGFGDGTVAVAVSGTWNAKAIQEKLGANYGVCKLPTVKDPDTNEDVQLSSFMGYKLYGVNPHSQNLVEAHKLAAFLSSEAMQQVRFEKHLVGPTNKTISALPAVVNDVTLAAINAQNAFAVEQTSVPANFWNPLKAYGLNIIDELVNEAGGGGKISYATQLNNMVTQIKSSITT